MCDAQTDFIRHQNDLLKSYEQPLQLSTFQWFVARDYWNLVRAMLGMLPLLGVGVTAIGEHVGPWLVGVQPGSWLSQPWAQGIRPSRGPNHPVTNLAAYMALFRIKPLPSRSPPSLDYWEPWFCYLARSRKPELASLNWGRYPRAPRCTSCNRPSGFHLRHEIACKDAPLICVEPSAQELSNYIALRNVSQFAAQEDRQGIDGWLSREEIIVDNDI
jgi:hypothetical protein